MILIYIIKFDLNINNMKTLQKIMENCDLLEEKGADEWQATRQLTDDEFRSWYLEDNQKWWNEHKKYHNTMPCARCNLEIKSPATMGS